MQQEKRRLLVILGMHRSGTSVLARASTVFGAQLGTHLLPPLPGNPRGFFEDERLVAGNKGLLAAFGLKWFSLKAPSAAQLRILAQGDAGAEGMSFLLDLLEKYPVTTIKDPRMCRLLAFWRPLWATLASADSGVISQCVLCIRQPDAVAASLQARNNMPLAYARRLWIAHTLDALSGSSGLERVLTDYDLFMEQPQAEIRRIAAQLHLEVDETALSVFLEEFLDAKLRHHTGSQNSAADDKDGMILAEEIYHTLQRVARDELSLEDVEFLQQMARWKASCAALPELAAEQGFTAPCGVPAEKKA